LLATVLLLVGQVSAGAKRVVQIGGLKTESNARAVELAGDYAYVANMFSGLLIIDISEPTRPRLVANLETACSAWDVAICGDYAYVADGCAGLQIVDVSDPGNPIIVGNYPCNSDSTRAVAVEGDYAYIIGESNLEVLDVSDPTSPYRTGYCLVGIPYNVAVSGGYAYPVTVENLIVVDVADPTSPHLVGWRETYWANGVDVVGNLVFVAREGGLMCFDVSMPNAPVLLSTYPTDPAGFCHGVTISGDWAYVADYARGLHILDVSDPSSPTLVVRYDPPGYTLDVAVSGDFVYLADYTYFRVLQVFDACCEGSCGNVDGDGAGSVDIADLHYLTSYLNGSGPEPPCLDEADINGDGVIDNSDVACLARHLFSKGNSCDLAECP